MSNDIENKLNAAGIDTATVRLNKIANDALIKANNNTIRAASDLFDAVMLDQRLLVKIMDKTEVMARCRQFVREIKAMEEQSKRTGASQTDVDGHCSDDLPGATSQQSSSGSHQRNESQAAIDPAAAPDDSTNAPRTRAVAPATNISKAAARRAASVFDEPVGSHFGMKIGDITRYDRLNLSINVAAMTVLDRELAKLPWPDDHTPIREFASEREVTKIRDLVNAARDKRLAVVKSRNERRLQ